MILIPIYCCGKNGTALRVAPRGEPAFTDGNAHPSSMRLKFDRGKFLAPHGHSQSALSERDRRRCLERRKLLLLEEAALLLARHTHITLYYFTLSEVFFSAVEVAVYTGLFLSLPLIMLLVWRQFGLT